MTQRPESAQTGKTAVNAVKQVLNELNWVANELFEDFGIDLHVKVFESSDSRRALPWEFHIQVKGTTALQRSKGLVLHSVDTEHLGDWQASLLPVLFLVYDVNTAGGYWVLIKDYLEALGGNWREKKSLTLRIPESDVATKDGLLEVFRRIRRTSFIHEAPRVIEFMRRPSEDMVGDVQHWIDGDAEPLEPPADSIREPALALCVACQQLFWIEQSWAAGHDEVDPSEPDMPKNLDFTAAYWPREHEPAVFMCDSPEEFCPHCMSGHAALDKCASCGRHRVPRPVRIPVIVITQSGMVITES
jgi:hypothetical protein